MKVTNNNCGYGPIQAIKEVRSLTGLSLKEARDLVDIAGRWGGGL